MKNNALLINIIAAISILISSAIAQNGADKNARKSKSAEANEPQKIVQELKPTISSEINLNKVATPSMSDVQSTPPVSKPIGETVVFNPRPAEMNIVIPKEEVKPVLPSTTIMHGETKTTNTTKDNNSQVNQGPKLAQEK